MDAALRWLVRRKRLFVSILLWALVAPLLVASRGATIESRTAQGPLWAGAAVALFVVVGILAYVTAYHGNVAALVLAGLVVLLSGILVFFSGSLTCPAVVGACADHIDYDPHTSFAGIALGALGIDMIGLGLIRYRWPESRRFPTAKGAAEREEGMNEPFR